MDEAAIRPGKRVRAADGYIGTVERLVHAEDAEGPNAGESGRTASLIVLSDDGLVRYRFPLSLAQQANGKRGAIRLALSSQDLLDYVIEGPDGEEVREGNRVGSRGDEVLSQAATTATELRVPLAEERLAAGTRPVDTGTVQLRKTVSTHEETMRVPVHHDEIVVERIPADQYDESRPAEPDEIIVPLLEERLVVEKRTVATEYIRIRKQRVEAIKEVQGTLRREHLDIIQERSDGTPAGPELHYPQGYNASAPSQSGDHG